MYNGNKIYGGVIMKKLLSVLLALIFTVLCFAACDGEVNNDDVHVHSYAEANCKDPRTCECGKTEGEALKSHNFENNECTVCQRPLIDGLGIAAKDKDGKNKSGFYVYLKDKNTGAVEKVTFSESEVQYNADGSRKDPYFGVTVTITQEGIVSGIYEWQFVRQVYVKESNYYDNDYLHGTFKASSLAENQDFNITENKDFTEDEAVEFAAKAYDLVNAAVEEMFVPIFEGNESNLTAADFGFGAYIKK